MARLVYIPEIDPNTYLHLSLAGETVLFRDFSRSPITAPEPFCPPDMTRDQVEELIRRKAGYSLRNQPTGVKDPGVTSPLAIGIWHRYIVELNKSIPADPSAEDDRLNKDQKEERLSILRWKKRQQMIAVATAFLALLAAIAGYWRKIVEFFSSS